MNDFRKVFKCWQTIFFYWFSVLKFNMRRDVSQNFNQGWAKNPSFYSPIYFFYDIIHLISIILKIQSILLDMDINLIYILYIL